jgi:hypothetical protein
VEYVFSTPNFCPFHRKAVPLSAKKSPRYSQMTLEELQFGALMLTSVLTIDLASRSLRQAGRVYNLSRWLMVTGIGLIAVQFLLQYTLHFRQASVTQGVAVNLVFFMLSSWLVSLAVLNLQRRGHVRVRERFFGLGCWAVAVGILGCGTLADGGPLLSDTPAMRTAEYSAAIVFALMQTYHTWLHWHEFSNIRHALNQYYDGGNYSCWDGWSEASICSVASPCCCPSSSSSLAPYSSSTPCSF